MKTEVEAREKNVNRLPHKFLISIYQFVKMILSFVRFVSQSNLMLVLFFPRFMLPFLFTQHYYTHAYIVRCIRISFDGIFVKQNRFRWQPNQWQYHHMVMVCFMGFFIHDNSLRNCFFFQEDGNPMGGTGDGCDSQMEITSFQSIQNIHR